MITLYTGPMMSKKTTTLVKKYKSMPQYLSIFISHSLNNREYLTHCKTKHNVCVASVSDLKEFKEILDYKSNGKMSVFIDEIQFFDPEIYKIIEENSELFDFYIGGLNKDFRGLPFETTSKVAMIADNVVVLSAICSLCEAEAQYSYRVSSDSNLILVGGEDMYIPLCRKCYKEKMKVMV